MLLSFQGGLWRMSYILANETGRHPEEGRNLGISQSRQSKIHSVEGKKCEEIECKVFEIDHVTTV
jgi:hypothetical protein